MSRILGVVTTCAALAVAGCGGVSELDPDEVETVSQARSAVNSALASGSLNAGGKETLEALMALCHEKPLAETGGNSMREVMSDLAPRLKSADPSFSRRMQRFSTDGCN